MAPLLWPRKGRKEDCGGHVAAERPRDRAVALDSLNLSKAESALSLKRRVPSNGMSMNDCWTSPVNPEVRNQGGAVRPLS
ncbi:hypothetical protein NDU88_006652 [Pleurodeles waltl]|uniref:Uncharacterized protein n=1 Tax=Pleurodeles waltl TaxID=8319 RepID=A0AAV7RNN2_PLEWA|nr:hypothetical protein NDU88_006652 [Pleurodeles waltl]